MKLPHDMGIPGAIGGGIFLIILLSILAQYLVARG
jgi:hypothetical protein